MSVSGTMSHDSSTEPYIFDQPRYFEESFMPAERDYSFTGTVSGPLIDRSLPRVSQLEASKRSASGTTMTFPSTERALSPILMPYLPSLATQTSVILADWEILTSADWNASFIDDGDRVHSPSSIESYDTSSFTSLTEQSHLVLSQYNHETQRSAALMYDLNMSIRGNDACLSPMYSEDPLPNEGLFTSVEDHSEAMLDCIERLTNIGGVPVEDFTDVVQRVEGSGLAPIGLSRQITTTHPLFARPQDIHDQGEDSLDADMEDGYGDDSSDSASDTDSSIVQSSAQDKSKQFRNDDALIVRLRREGASYFEIKQRCGFKQAISTLRGRFRNATTPKEARPRKQIWSRFDVVLLHQAVAHYTLISKKHNKIPWKQVSVWMKEHGASYEFAPASISKKWAVIQNGGH